MDFGSNSKKSPSDFYGNKITAAAFDADSILLHFENGRKLQISDEAQSCCENRYMTSDDDIQELVGHTLSSISLKNGPVVEQDYDVHEIVFLEIQAGHITFTVSTHNEHNGYYGGFSLVLKDS